MGPFWSKVVPKLWISILEFSSKLYFQNHTFNKKRCYFFQVHIKYQKMLFHFPFISFMWKWNDSYFPKEGNNFDLHQNYCKEHFSLKKAIYFMVIEYVRLEKSCNSLLEIQYKMHNVIHRPPFVQLTALESNLSN
jgi:hypothetical protein